MLTLNKNNIIILLPERMLICFSDLFVCLGLLVFFLGGEILLCNSKIAESTSFTLNQESLTYQVTKFCFSL